MVETFHQIAVAGDHEGAVVDQVFAIECVQMPLGDRHPDRHRDALAERAGGRLDPRQLEILRMARARAAELPEVA